jgi:phosphoribosylamine--glycine ligase
MTNNPDDLEKFITELDGNFVVKADGLMGGKGVKVSGEHLADTQAGIAYARECLTQGSRVVIEEKLIGQEFSYLR